MNDEEMFQGAVSLARGLWPGEDPEAVTAGCLQVLLRTTFSGEDIRGALAVCGEAMAAGSFGFEEFVAGMMAGGLRFRGDGAAAGAALVAVCAALNRWRGQELRLPMRITNGAPDGGQMVEEIMDPAPMKVVRVAIPGQGRSRLLWFGKELRRLAALPEQVRDQVLSSLVGAEGLPMALGLMVLWREAHEDGRIGTLG